MKRLELRKQILDRIEIPVEEKSILAGKIKTNYLVTDSVDVKKEVTLLIHGNNPGGAVSWYPVIKSLSNYSQIIAPDVVGYGESDKPFGKYDRTFFVSWLVNFIDALQIDTVNIIGLSQGGSIALQMAIDHPDRLNKLVLADSGSLGEGMPLGALLGFIWCNTLPSSFSRKLLNRYVANDTDKIDEIWNSYTGAVQRTFRSKLSFWLGAGKVTKPILEEQLNNIMHETLIIWGEEEKMFPVSHAEYANRIIPNSQLHLIKDAGHVTFFDQPEAFNDVVINFLYNCTENKVH